MNAASEREFLNYMGKYYCILLHYGTILNLVSVKLFILSIGGGLGDTEFLLNFNSNGRNGRNGRKKSQ